MTLMTSWAVVCDVYFLEPQSQKPDESAQEFAERVQHLIAKKANLKVAPWDGYLKYYNLGKKVRVHFHSVRLLFYSMQCDFLHATKAWIQLLTAFRTYQAQQLFDKNMFLPSKV